MSQSIRRKSPGPWWWDSRQRWAINYKQKRYTAPPVFKEGDREGATEWLFDKLSLIDPVYVQELRNDRAFHASGATEFTTRGTMFSLSERTTEELNELAGPEPLGVAVRYAVSGELIMRGRYAPDPEKLKAIARKVHPPDTPRYPIKVRSSPDFIRDLDNLSRQDQALLELQERNWSMTLAIATHRRWSAMRQTLKGHQ